MTTLVKVANAMQPHVHEATEIKSGVRISTLMRDIGYLKGRGSKAQRTHAFVVTVNTVPVMYSGWGRRLKANDVVSVINMPAGGQGGSNPLQIVLMVAVMIAAIYTGGAVAAAYSTTAGMAAQAGVMVAGMALIALTTPTPSLGQDNTGRSASPTYTINAQGNMARLGEVQAVTYGRMTQFPDYAAAPYTEINGNEQYLYQLFQLTRGYTEVHRVLIEDTPTDSFTGIQMQIVNPGEKVTLFPSNVYTPQAINGLELMAPDAEGAPPSGLVGPFVIVPKDEEANAIAVDIHYPRGGFTMNDKGKYRSVSASYVVSYAEIDENDNVIGPWVENVFSENINTDTPQMKSHRFEVAPGRYALRAARTTPKGDRQTNLQIVLAQARAYMPTTESYGNVTMLAMVIKATNQINQSTQRKIKVEHTRKLSKWDPVNGWTAPVATRNPLWAYVDILRDTEYGAGLPNNRFDMREIARLAAVADARNDYFDYVYDQVAQTWAAAALALRATRSTPAYVSGQITAIRNEPRSLPVAMFDPHSMIAGSFNVEYQFSDGVSTPDYVVAEYTNWQTNKPETVECFLPGSPRLRPVTLKLPGVTDRDQAWREGMSVAAQNRDQRRVVSFQTELAGLVPKYLDLIQISHDVPQWGYSGTVQYYNPTANPLEIQDPYSGEIIATFAPWELRTSEPCPFVDGTHQIAFRKRDGSADGPYNVIRGPGGENSLIVQNAVGLDRSAIYVSDGAYEELTGYQFGPATRRGLRAVCLSATPDENGRVRITATNYADSVHVAETGGAVPPPGPESNLPGADGAPIINRVTIEETVNAMEQNIVATPASGALYYEFEISHDGNSWVNYGISADPYMRVTLEPGTWYARVRAFGRAMGPWTTGQATLTGNVLPIPRLEAAFATTNKVLAIELSWVFETGLQQLASDVQVYSSLTPNFANASPFVTVPAPATSYHFTVTKHAQEMYFWFRVIDTAGRVGAWFNNGVGIMGQSSSDANVVLDLLEGQLTSEQFIEDLRETIDEIPTIAAEIPLIKQDLTQTKADLSTETQARIDADGALAGRIDTVEATANGAGALIQAETQARIDGDTALGTRIDTLQATVGQSVDAFRNWSFDSDVEGWRVNSQSAVKLEHVNETPKYIRATGLTLAGGVALAPAMGPEGIDFRTNNMLTFRIRFPNGSTRNNLYFALYMDGAAGQLGTSLGSIYIAADQFKGANKDWQIITVDVTKTYTEAQLAPYSKITCFAVGHTTHSVGATAAEKMYDLDYVTFGKLGNGISRAQFRDEIKVVADATTAVSQQVTQQQVTIGQNTAAIQAESTARADADSALATRINQVEAVAKPMFDTERVWNFDSSAEGWGPLTGASTVIWQNAAPYFIRTASADDTAIGRAQIVIPAAQRFDPKLNNIMRIRIRFPNGSRGATFITYVAINDSTSYGTQSLNVVIPNKDSTDWQEIDIDFSKFPGAVPTATNISRITMGDTRPAGNGTFELDYVAIGRYSAPLSRAAFREETTTRVNAEESLSQRITTAQSTASNADAKAQTSLTASTNLGNAASSNYSVKVQAAANGKLYGAGMSINVLAGPGGGQTDVAFIADRFSIMHDTNGAVTLPFLVQNGQVLIRQALIGTGWITTAHIADAAITNAKIGNLQVTGAKIDYSAIGTAHIQDAAIATAKIGVAQIDTLRIAGGAVVTSNVTEVDTTMGASSGSDFATVVCYLPQGGHVMLFMDMKCDALYATNQGTPFDTARMWVRTNQFGEVWQMRFGLAEPMGPNSSTGMFRGFWISPYMGIGQLFVADVCIVRPVTNFRRMWGRFAAFGMQR